MYKIFICYRTTDSAYAAAHIFTELFSEFGKEITFEYSHEMSTIVKLK